MGHSGDCDEIWRYFSRPLKNMFNGLLKQAMDGLHEYQQRQFVDVRGSSRIHFATSRVEKGQESPFSTSC